jgi:hypothetical protein
VNQPYNSRPQLKWKDQRERGRSEMEVEEEKVRNRRLARSLHVHRLHLSLVHSTPPSESLEPRFLPS